MEAKKAKAQNRAGAPDPQEIVELHTKASRELKQHREEYQALLDAGEKASAQQALQRIRKLETVVRALQAKEQ